MDLASMSPSWRRLSMIFVSRSASLTTLSAKRWRSFGAGSPSRLSAARRRDVRGVFSSWTRLATCLLYTSDAADDLLCVDLGGRRIIKKKKKQNILQNLN